MIGMDQYELIRTAHNVYGKGVRQIAREYGHSRKTVRKALRGEVPRYRRKKPPHEPVMGMFRDVVDRWLIEDQASPKKQRHTAIRVYHRLVDEYGFGGSESTVRRYVRERKADLGLTHVEAMVPLVHELESGAEVDWGEALVRLGGVDRKVKLFYMRSKYSGKLFVQAYPAERQEMLFDGHMRAFQFFGGVFREITYDNLSTAVNRILKGRHREEQEQFFQFRSYYSFRANFCAPAKGNEKGGVEGGVGYARRNFLVPRRDFGDFEELNAFLMKQCKKHGERPKHWGGEIIDELHRQQKPTLIPIQQRPFPNILLKSGKVNKYQTIQVDRNMYSVPAPYVGHKVQVQVGSWKIRFFFQQRQIACHRRHFGKRQWQLNPFHYLETLHRKTRAFDDAMPLKTWRKSWPPYYEKLLSELRRRHGERLGIQEFIEVLRYHEIYPPQRVMSSVRESVEKGVYRVSAIKHLILKNGEQTPQTKPLAHLDHLPKVLFSGPILNQYNALRYQP